MTGFGDRLMDAVRAKRTPVMLGIDPRIDSLPNELRPTSNDPDDLAGAVERFGRAVLETVSDLVGVVKFQSAFFEVLGVPGLAVLDRLTRFADQLNLVVVMDAKRGDIGSTAEAYAQAYLGRTRWSCHALTVNPFLGRETLEPFVETAERSGTGVFVLVRTSNPGSGDLQMVSVAGGTISDRLAGWVEEWSKASAGTSGFGHVGAVVGATHADEIASFRAKLPHAVLLLPGYGAQGATATDIARAFNAQGLGAVVNNSRGLLYAYQKEAYRGLSWTEALRAATLAMIEDLAQNTPAGMLRK